MDYHETLTPNFMAAVHHNGVQYALFIAEIKKPGTRERDKDDDRRSLVSQMKLSLDKLLWLGTESPTIVGFLIQGMCSTIGPLTPSDARNVDASAELG